MGTAVDPASLGGAARYAHQVSGRPVLVTEHGIGIEDDAMRAGFIEPSLAGLLDAMDDGVPVLGYFHWTLLDNFEWIFGYSKHFGLHEVDRETFVRTPKASAAAYAADRQGPSGACLAMTTAPHGLRVEHLDEPLGIRTAAPGCPGGCRTAPASSWRYRLRADNGWDTGWVDSAQSLLVPYDGPPLASAQRVEWQVQVRTDLGESPWSEHVLVRDRPAVAGGLARRPGSSRVRIRRARRASGRRRCCGSSSTSTGRWSAPACTPPPRVCTRRSSTASGPATPN